MLSHQYYYIDQDHEIIEESSYEMQKKTVKTCIFLR